MTMKRLFRSPEKFEVIDLFTSLGRTYGFSLRGNGGQDKFLQTIKNSFDESLRNPMFLHGRHTQAIFSYVAASLGRASLIKEEDAGEFIVTDPDLKIPDFHIVLLDASNFLVEVKNFRHDLRKPMKLKRGYLEALERYSRLVGIPLRFAIYWSQASLWTLVSLPHLPRQNGNGWIDMPKAMKINEMADLGDMQVGTTPPLVLRILTDPTKPRGVDDQGHVNFTIGKLEFYCGGLRIDSKEEQRMAHYFMLHGSWTGSEPRAHIIEGSLVHIDFEVNHPAPTSGQEFEILGYLSTMISRRFNDLTAPKGTIERLVPASSPGSLGIVIPRDYKGKHLPLWCFVQEPNYE